MPVSKAATSGRASGLIDGKLRLDILDVIDSPGPRCESDPSEGRHGACPNIRTAYGACPSCTASAVAAVTGWRSILFSTGGTLRRYA